MGCSSYELKRLETMINSVRRDIIRFENTKRRYTEGGDNSEEIKAINKRITELEKAISSVTSDKIGYKLK